jgi:HEAT repeat protein
LLGPPPLPRNLDASVRDLSSARAEVRASSVEDLVRHARLDAAVRTRAVPLLVQRLTDEDPRVRAAAAVALGDLAATDAVSSLLLLVEDDVAHVRQMAINALGEIGDPRALPRLRRALKDARPEVRYQTVIAFARVADGKTPDHSEDRPSPVRSLDASEVDDALFAASSDSDDAVAHIALRVAEERHDAGHSPDERLLARARALVDARQASPHVALVAAILLAKTGDERGNDTVLRVVKGERIRGQAPDKEDERAAVELAGELGLSQAIPHLERRTWGIARFVRDTCPFHARIALARMGHERARAEILEELRSSRREVISGAVVSAGRARITEARDTIEQLTTASVDPELVLEALLRLGEP